MTGVEMPVRLRDGEVRAHRYGTDVPVATYVVLLCIGSGSLDAISFLALGDAFASVMTGNIVFLGMSAVHGSAELALYCGTALVGYAIGGACTSRLAHVLRRADEAEVWPVRVTILLGGELVILVGLAIAWWWCDGDPGRAEQHLLLAGAAVAMGIQSAAVRVMGVPVSTTYMTGALTTLLEAVATRRAFSHTERGASVGLLSLAVGAMFGTVLLEYERPAALLVPCIGLAITLVSSVLRHRRERRT